MNYFISDIHLKSDTEENAKKLIDFLNRFSGKRLFLVGDIFDLWVADGTCFKAKYQRVINAISALVAKGVEVHYFEGNHDLYLKKFWQNEMGVGVYTKAEYFDIDGLQIRIEHGDDANPADIKYIKYKNFIRSKFMASIAYLIPGRLLEHYGTKASHESRSEESRYPWDVGEVLRSYIHKVYAENPFDVLITGHMHRQIDEEINIGTKKVRNINLGWWGDGPKALKLENSKFSWLEI